MLIRWHGVLGNNSYHKLVCFQNHVNTGHLFWLAAHLQYHLCIECPFLEPISLWYLVAKHLYSLLPDVLMFGVAELVVMIIRMANSTNKFYNYILTSFTVGLEI